MMRDFFDRLEFELIDAARREATAASMGSRRRRRRRFFTTRPLLAAGVGLVVASSATAGIITLASSEDSAPIRGSVVYPPVPGRAPHGDDLTGFCKSNPGSCPGSGPSTTKYAIVLRPFATSPDTGHDAGGLAGAGQSGWCVTVELMTGKSGGNVTGCSPATTPQASARIVGAGFGTGKHRMTVLIVDQRVAAVRLSNGHDIRPRPDRVLPTGWKAALWSGGTDSPASVRLLDEQGVRLPNGGRTAARLRQVQPGGAASTARYRGCVVKGQGVALHDVRSVLDAPKPSTGLSGRPFLICGTARVRDPAGDSQVFVLVDADRPGAPPAALPGATSSATPGVVTIGSDATARHDGNAWLVVTSDPGTDKDSTKASAQRREQLLDRLHLESP